MSYIPRGYISTIQAMDRLFELRHADLVSSGPAREEERRYLDRLIHGPFKPGQPCSEYTLTDLNRLAELSSFNRNLKSLREAVARDLRTALAEGDVATFILTRTGDIQPISISRWRTQDAFASIASGLITLPARWVSLGSGGDVGPVLFQESVGTVLIREADFVSWVQSLLTIGSPEQIRRTAAKPEDITSASHAIVRLEGSTSPAPRSTSAQQSRSGMPPLESGDRPASMKKRGHVAKKRNQAIATMMEDVKSGKMSYQALYDMPDKDLTVVYEGKRSTLRLARTAVLDRLFVDGYLSTTARDEQLATEKNK